MIYDISFASGGVGWLRRRNPAGRRPENSAGLLPPNPTTSEQPVNPSKSDLIMISFNSRFTRNKQNNKDLKQIWNRQDACPAGCRGGRSRGWSRSVEVNRSCPMCRGWVAIRFLARGVLMLYRASPS